MTLGNTTSLLLVLTVLTSQTSHAAPSVTPTPRPTAPAPGARPATSAPSANPSSAPALPPLYKPAPDRVISDNWYTVTVQPNVRYAYYNDRLEMKGGKLFLQNRFWKQEEGYLNEEQLGAFAENTSAMTPLFFNFHSTYRTTEIKVDGTIQDGRILTVKIRKGSGDLPVIRKGVPRSAILSVFFPVWMASRLPAMKPNQTVSFYSILEDNIEMAFQSVSGSIRLEAPDAFSTKTNTFRVFVNFKDLKSTWYVERTGIPIRVEMPTQKTIIERVTKEKAEKFLDE